MSEQIIWLEHCPHCGSAAELDLDRPYRCVASGVLGHAVAIQCTVCEAEMMHCYEDFPGQSRDFLRDNLVGLWNRRSE